MAQPGNGQPGEGLPVAQSAGVAVGVATQVGDPPTLDGARQRRRLALVVLVALALGMGVAGYSIYAHNEQARPIAAVQRYCQALASGQFAGAYALLSAQARAQVTQARFMTDAALHDQIDGTVRSCSVQGGGDVGLLGLDLDLSRTTTTLQLRMVHQRLDAAPGTSASAPMSTTGSVALVKEGGAWEIVTLAPTLQGTDLAPFAAADAYCAALLAHDYARAYAAFAPAYQAQLGSTADYTTALVRLFSGDSVALTACAPIATTYSVVGDDASATVQARLQFHTPGGGAPVTASQKLTLVQLGGVWRLSASELLLP